MAGASPLFAFPRVDVAHARASGARMSAVSDQGAVTLTLDPELQRDVMALLARSHAHDAGAVIIDVRTGRILAWASVGGSGRDMVASAVAPPASLFKVVATTALLDKAHVSAHAKQCYVGGERSARLSDLRPNGAGEGVRCEQLSTALGYSRNLVVAGLAVKHLNSSSLDSTARLLGIGDDLPIDVQVERSMVKIPQGDEAMARVAAGFGDGRMSPLSAAFMMSVIARGGRAPSLKLLDQGAAAAGSGPQVISEGTAGALTRMLEITVREGTCAKAFRDSTGRPYLGGVRVAGKTGTLARGRPTRMYSWFAGFAPSNRPEIAVAVMLANDVSWWQKGNQVGRDVLRAYFARKGTAGVKHPLK